MVFGIVNGGIGMYEVGMDLKYKIVYVVVVGVFGGLYIGVVIWGIIKSRWLLRVLSKEFGLSG